MKRIILFLFFILMTSLNNAVALDHTKWSLSPNGFGPIKMDMTLKQVEHVTGKKFNSATPDPHQAENESCFLVTLKGIDNVSFMVSGNKIVRININSPNYQTSMGAKIGDTESRVQALYKGKLTIEAHHYDPKGHYLTLFEKHNNRGIRFESNGEVITLIYSGNHDEVQYVEDCL
ncbi:hypothetical protein [Legionella parisiensis]|uniref:Uncharacterized protein n=1 Tax=Legionella parisiensis TaxID=45071 RepID=A0A1E5JS80_9GAMM|nr:hypothetical protein [Legionella parisiensis]KTD42120.1 hypothetical protein Lpar_3437 [Legionella parisiensis]OEH47377.1 hypothetical protein lpari_01545 [Legionella parisiensis]STX75330.1 Uncharacterised protein [Legionella parisiensis]